MKQFCCGEVVPGCQARFQGIDAEDVIVQVAAHAKSAHGLHDLSPALLAQVHAAMT